MPTHCQKDSPPHPRRLANSSMPSRLLTASSRTGARRANCAPFRADAPWARARLYVSPKAAMPPIAGIRARARL